jgi:type II secretory pathway pseudopilin PulG
VDNNTYQNARGSAYGYSLTELIIVILLVTVVASTAVPNINALQRQWDLWGSARSLEASLQWGRMHAISSNAPVLFEVADEGRKYYWVDPSSGDSYADSERRLPGGIRIVSYPRRPLRFYQHGNAVPAGTYRIEGTAGSYSVVVSPGGRIRVQKN